MSELNDFSNVQRLLSALDEALSEGEGSGESETGFVDSPPEGNSNYVFLNRQEFDYGYMLDDDGNPIRKPARCIRGRLTEVEHFTRMTDYGASQKLRTRLETEDGSILVETGFFTNTAKSIISSLQSLDGPSMVTLEPDLPDGRQSGNSQNVLFVEVYEDGDLITNSEWPQTDQDVIDAFRDVRQNALGLPPQEEDQPTLPNQQQPSQGRQQPTQRRGGGGRQQQQQQRQPRQGGQQQQRQPAGGGGNGAPTAGGDGQAAQGGAQQGQPNQSTPSRDNTQSVPGNAPPPTA